MEGQGRNAQWQKILRWAICSILRRSPHAQAARDAEPVLQRRPFAERDRGNFGITRQGARDAIKHGETTLKELEAKVGFAARYRRVQEKLEELEQLVVDARFECTGPYAKLTTTEYAATLTKMLGIIRSMDEVNES